MNEVIRRATVEDARAVAELAVQMWTSHSVQELTEQFREVLADSACAVYLMLVDNQAVGFSQCGLRVDYVEGTGTSPVGYLEGIFIAERYRNRGLAQRLLACCEDWAREQGCSEFASDCELDNEISRLFHLSVGFAEANRIICFTKKL